MATKVNINGKIVSRPGVYTLLKSGIRNPPAGLDFGHVLLVDDGIGAGYGGGSGSTAYTFERIEDFREFVKGGPLWSLAEPLFKPLKGQLGASKVTLIQARESTPGVITLDLDAGDVVLTTIDKGVNVNGVTSGGELRKGYAAKMLAGSTTDTYVVQIWAGSFKGIDPLTNSPYEALEANSKPSLIAQSPDLASVSDLVAWLNTDPKVSAGFTVSGQTTGDLIAADLTANSGYVLATGGTETYSPEAFAASIEVSKNVDFNFILCTKYGANAQHANNIDLIESISDAKYKKFVVVAGGADNETYLTQSEPAAVAFNSDQVIVVHGDGKRTTNTGFKRVSSLWKAANVLGRICGLEPQTPITYKQLGIDAEWEELTEALQERALDKGVLVSFFDSELGYDVVLQGINTLQNNAFLVNEDATSHDIAVSRVTAELNKGAALYIKRKFFSKASTGPNRNTITEQDITAAMDGYLQSKVASTLNDNLILRYGNITVTTEGDAYRVSYEFVPNFPVNKIIVTGIILDK